MSQVTYGTEKVNKKTVYYAGTSVVKGGYLVCYVENTPTGGTVSNMLTVEKPTTENLSFFAGVVDQDDVGTAGPRFLRIVEPSKFKPGTLVKAYRTGATGDVTTKLGVVATSWYLAAASASQPQVAQQAQTGVTDGAEQVLVRLLDVGKADVTTALTGTGISAGAGTSVTGASVLVSLKADVVVLGSAINNIRTALIKAGLMDIS